MKKNNNLNNAAANTNNMNGGFIMSTGTIKTVEDFAQMAKEAFGAEYPECEVEVRKVTENNGLVLTGLAIHDRKTNIAPTIYLDGYFGQYQQGRPVADIFAAVGEMYLAHKGDMDFDISMISKFGNVQGRLCYKVINRDRNAGFLEDVPYIPYLDLAIVFYVLVSDGADGTASVTVHNDLYARWGSPDKRELFALAKDNTQRLFKGRVSSVSEIMGEILADGTGAGPDMADAAFGMDNICEDGFCPMFVATNTRKLNGAGVMFYNGLLRSFAQKIGKSFYILPISVHELIFVPDNGGLDAGYLGMMVREINGTEVLPNEVLSDHVYRYDIGTGRMELV